MQERNDFFAQDQGDQDALLAELDQLEAEDVKIPQPDTVRAQPQT